MAPRPALGQSDAYKARLDMCKAVAFTASSHPRRGLKLEELLVPTVASIRATIGNATTSTTPRSTQEIREWLRRRHGRSWCATQSRGVEAMQERRHKEAAGSLGYAVIVSSGSTSIRTGLFAMGET